MTYVIYHPFPINSQYLKTWGVDSPDQTSLKGVSIKPTKIKTNPQVKTCM